ncbi:hypothetical protein [uncultured Brevundimonas sp.]|uniref:hypothetical protein n=1 Tax=uncultured Brevundimonas sp. TaxID=213418 RepID=UPI002620DA7E|nr:hypothetical protein [uncultured Brevundimonas sp.]
MGESKPHFWSEADIIMSETATLTITQARKMADCLHRDIANPRSRRMGQEALDCYRDLMPAIWDAEAFHQNQLEQAA